MIRRFGEPVDPNQQYKARPGVYAILPRGASLLLTHQMTPSSELQLPGGGIDPGEHVLHALHREVLEETGWRISSPLRLGVFRRFVYMPEYEILAEKICHIYLASPVHPLGEPSEPDHEAVFVPTERAAGLLSNEGDAWFVRSFLRQVRNTQ